MHVCVCTHVEWMCVSVFVWRPQEAIGCLLLACPTLFLCCCVSGHIARLAAKPRDTHVCLYSCGCFSLLDVCVLCVIVLPAGMYVRHVCS